MRTLWTKIGLGALGVFLVGMLLLTVVEDAKSTMKEALTRVTRPLHVATADLQADIPFVLAGQRRGTVNGDSSATREIFLLTRGRPWQASEISNSASVDRAQGSIPAIDYRSGRPGKDPRHSKGLVRRVRQIRG